jgi:hypothetical protein
VNVAKKKNEHGGNEVGKFQIAIGILFMLFVLRFTAQFKRFSV